MGLDIHIGKDNPKETTDEAVHRSSRKPKGKRKHKDVISKCMSYICKNTTNIPVLLAHLVSLDVITMDQEEEINVLSTRREQCRMLVALFYRKDLKSFDEFKAALVESRNQHVAEVLDAKETEMNDQPETSDTKDERRRRRQHRKKKGKMFSVYAASGSESDSSSSEEDEDKDELEAEALETLFRAVEAYLKSLNYYPYTEFRFNRFNEAQAHLIPARGGHVNCCTMIPSNLKWKCEKSIFSGRQKFRVNRPVYLSKVGFYGPAKAPVASYTVNLELVKGRLEILGTIGQTKQVVEARENQIFYIPFRFPIAIEPHIWYKLKFSIKGTDEILMESPLAKSATKIIPCKEFGDFRFDFSRGCNNSTCQLPIFCFYVGKERLLTDIFPSTREQMITYTTQQEVRDWMLFNKDVGSDALLY